MVKPTYYIYYPQSLVGKSPLDYHDLTRGEEEELDNLITKEEPGFIWAFKPIFLIE